MRALAVWLALAASAGAAEHPLVQIEIDPCVNASRDDVRRLVAIELGSLVADAPGSDQTRVAVGCKETLVELRVDDPITRKSLVRDVDLAETVPRARARLLALAIAELVSASWIELEAIPSPKVPPAGPAPSLEAKRAATVTVRRQIESSPFDRFRLTAFGTGAGFFTGPGLTGGGGMQLARDHAYHVGWQVDLQAAHGNAVVPLGSVSVDLINVGTAFVMHYATPRIAFQGGVGLRGGAARLSGSPVSSDAATGGTVWGAWGGPLATASLGVAVSRRLLVDLAAEAGYVVVPVGGLVADVRQVAVDGAWLSFRVGFGVFL